MVAVEDEISVVAAAEAVATLEIKVVVVKDSVIVVEDQLGTAAAVVAAAKAAKNVKVTGFVVIAITKTLRGETNVIVARLQREIQVPVAAVVHHLEAADSEVAIMDLVAVTEDSEAEIDLEMTVDHEVVAAAAANSIMTEEEMIEQGPTKPSKIIAVNVQLLVL